MIVNKHQHGSPNFSGAPQYNGGITMKKVTLKQGQELLKLLQQSDIGRDPFQELLESGDFSDLLRKYKTGSKPTILTFKVPVDYSMSIKQIMKPEHYEKIDSRINDRQISLMNRNQNHMVELQMICFNKDMLNMAITDEFEKRNLRPAELIELLSLVDAQLKTPLPKRCLIVALESHNLQSDCGEYSTLHYYEYKGLPELGLTSHPDIYEWSDGTYFLAAPVEVK